MKLMTKKIEELNRIALKYYLTCLDRSPRAKKYLYNRIDKDITNKYLIGYAPNGGFISYLNRFDVKSIVAREAGLITIDYEGHAYERFSNRIVIPIIHAGRVLGFGGRSLGNVTKKNPKYLNSKSSVLYNKSTILYGLWNARKAMEMYGYGFLVEGYFDVLTFADHGLPHCVAVCGTAVTPQHAELLRRYTQKIYVLFDGDTAGTAAAKKAKKVLKKANIYSGRIKLPKNLDPADFINRYGRKALKKLPIVK